MKIIKCTLLLFMALSFSQVFAAKAKSSSNCGGQCAVSSDCCAGYYCNFNNFDSGIGSCTKDTSLKIKGKK